MFRALAFLLTAAVPALQAQTGLLVVAHGADTGWNARVDSVVAQVHWKGPVRAAFVMGPAATSRSFAGERDSLVAAGARRIVVVPLMVSTYGNHVRDIDAMTAGSPSDMTSMTPQHDDLPAALPARVTAALDDAPELGVAITDRWLALSPGDRRLPLVLVAHGPNTDEEARHWVDNLTRATMSLAGRLPDRAVHVGLIRDDAPPPVRARAVAQIRDTIATLSRRSGDSVMVMTVLISSGSINSVVVPHDLDGMPMHYAGSALAPDPALARWIERVAAAVEW